MATRRADLMKRWDMAKKNPNTTPEEARAILDEAVAYQLVAVPTDEKGNELVRPDGKGYIWSEEALNMGEKPLTPWQMVQKMQKVGEAITDMKIRGVPDDAIWAYGRAEGMPDASIAAYAKKSPLTIKEKMTFEDKDADREAKEKYQKAMLKLKEKTLALQERGVEVREVLAEIAQGNYELAQKRLELAVNEFNAGGKPDKYGRDPDAIADELSDSDKSKAQKLGFNTYALMHGPARITAFMGTQDDPESPYWKSVTMDRKRIRVLTDKGRARIKEINNSEMQRHGVSGPLAPARPGLSSELERRAEEFRRKPKVKFNVPPKVNNAIARALQAAVKDYDSGKGPDVAKWVRGKLKEAGAPEDQINSLTQSYTTKYFWNAIKGKK
jgi:hypothetical protein